MRQETSFLLTFIMLFLSIGCSNTHIIQPNESIHIKKYGTLFKKDFERIDVSEFYSFGDSIIALRHNTNELLEYSKLDVTKIVMWNRSKGAKHGAIAGALGASSLCYLLCPDNSGEALGGKEVGAFIWFFFGGFLGTPVGYVIGSNDVYEFITDRPEAIESKKESDNTDVGQTKPPAIVIVEDPDVDQTKPPAIVIVKDSDVDETKHPAIVIVKDPEIEKIRVKEKMIATSKKPLKIPSNYYALRIGTGFGNIPTIKNSEGSTIEENSGSGIGGAYQLWFAVRSNIHIGLFAGGIGFIQEDGNLTRTRMIEYFNLAIRKYPKKKNYYFEGAIGFSRLSQKLESTDYSLGSTGNDSVLFDSSINGFGISAGIGTILIRGKKFEILLNGNFAYNVFKGGKKSALFGINVEIMFPRLITK